MDLMKIIQSQLTDTVINQLSSNVQAQPQQTANATSSIINTLVGALSKNVANEQGASSLFNAVQKDHDGSLLDNLTDFLNPQAANPVSARATNGTGILQHLLGDKVGGIAQLIGQQTGVGQQGASSLMSTLAPIVLATLGKQSKQSGFGIADLAGLLTNQGQQVRQQQQQQSQGGLGDLLKMVDFDGDGSGLDDAMGFLGNLLKK